MSELRATTEEDDAMPDRRESAVAPTREERPTEPEFRAVQRCALVYRFNEGEERQEGRETGWARVDGPWVIFLPDDSAHWVTWPIQAVVALDWEVFVP